MGLESWTRAFKCDARQLEPAQTSGEGDLLGQSSSATAAAISNENGGTAPVEVPGRSTSVVELKKHSRQETMSAYIPKKVTPQVSRVRRREERSGEVHGERSEF
ncbi:uncharacterized protein LOC120353363 [Nilaparvata lugens]|uniref:uncharacterized protein LOC120353363 n=1 Tax=Nilaparvata lugens TaxID=108931 RepID=UPI00193EA4A9|nr:uncharacterized protein LOC120353363 [Nilaparvata lugens]XP_039292713.1 uncharacterized protein LOC120353363 [Nilaparvata lugens]